MTNSVTNRFFYHGGLFLVLVSTLFIPNPAYSVDPLTLGVFPRRNPQITTEMFTPLANILSRQLAREVKIEVSKDFEAFWEGVAEHRYDLVHYNQYHYIRSARELGYQVILKNEEFGHDTLASAIIVRKDGGIESLDDLRGKKIVFGGGPSAMVSYILNTHLLRQAGLKEGDYVVDYAISPLNAVYAAYYSHAAAAGAGNIALRLPSVKMNIKPDELTNLVTSKQVAHIPWAVKGDMNPELRNRIQSILSNLENTEHGTEILRQAGLTGLNVAIDSEYDEHRRIVKQVLGEDYCAGSCGDTPGHQQESAYGAKLVMSVFPRREKEKTTQMFQPMADHLSQVLGGEVKLETHKTFKEFWQGIKEKRYDIIHANQFQYIRSHKLYGYNVILKNEEFGSSTITPAIYVRKDSGINSLEDLRGKRIIFGGGKLAMVSYVGNLQLLQQAGLEDNEYTWKFAVTPPNGCHAMYLKQADACGAATVLMKLKSFTTKVDTSEIRELSKNIPLTHVNWSVKDSMSPQLQNKIQNTLADLNKSQQGRAVLKTAGLTRLRQTTDREYDVHRKIIRDVLGEQY